MTNWNNFKSNQISVFFISSMIFAAHNEGQRANNWYHIRASPHKMRPIAGRFSRLLNTITNFMFWPHFLNTCMCNKIYFFEVIVAYSSKILFLKQIISQKMAFFYACQSWHSRHTEFEHILCNHWEDFTKSRCQFVLEKYQWILSKKGF